MVVCFERLWNHLERFLSTILAQWLHSWLSSHLLILRTVMDKARSYKYNTVRVIFCWKPCLVRGGPSWIKNSWWGREEDSYSVHTKICFYVHKRITIQRLKMIRLLMRTVLTKSFFVHLVTFWRLFTCDQTKTHSHSLHLSGVRYLQNSVLDDATIANENG